MKKMVLLSGGLDSTTCLALAVDSFGAENVLALSAYYGQKHERELESAEAVSNYYGVKRIVLDLEPIFEGSGCSLLKWSGEEIPKKEYRKQIKERNGNPLTTYVPFRNGLFVSVATALAIANGCDEIYYGAHKDDSEGDAYPDCSEEFNKAIGEAVYLGSGKSVNVVAPFVGIKKTDIVGIGLKLKVPYELTWSCYEGGERPCGVCGTCIDRQEAFLKNGEVDPLCR